MKINCLLYQLTLALLMPRLSVAYYAQHTIALDHLAVSTNLFYRRPNFHNIHLNT
tara:strand:- start:471 stop:635 length:165 start_codon:yes stop_codon:yes gene_type:complete